jgi:hypothetical protein
MGSSVTRATSMARPGSERSSQLRVADADGCIANIEAQLSRQSSRRSLPAVVDIIVVPRIESVMTIDALASVVNVVVGIERIKTTGGLTVLVNWITTSCSVRSVVIVAEVVVVVVSIHEQVHQEMVRLKLARRSIGNDGLVKVNWCI